MKTNLSVCHEVFFVMGNSLMAGTREWANRRQKEQQRAELLLEKVEGRDGEAGCTPHSLGKYGRSGHRSYPNGVHPPWLVHLVAEIASGFDNVTILQSECDKDYAIMCLANKYKCPIISNDSDFLLYAVAPVIR